MVLILNFVLPAIPCLAEIYRWQDENGNWHFSDSPTSEAPIELPPTPSYEESVANTPVEPDAVPAPPSRPSSHKQGDHGDLDYRDDLDDPPSETSVQGGLLWRVGRSGLRPSYLLGTIHSADPRVVRLRPAVQEALDHSDHFIMEMQMDAGVLLSLGADMMISDGRDLKSLIGRDLYRKVIKAMEGYGFPEMVVNTFKPWAVMALLSMPKPSGEPVLDMILNQRAMAAGIPTAGLESAQEQLAVFEGLSMPDQIALLKMAIAQLPDLPRLFDELIRAYAADDLQKITDLAANYSRRGHIEANQRFMLQLNDNRNRRMAERMLPYLQQGNSFFAVGALHLTGPAGLIRLLRQHGYQVSPLR